MDEFTTLLDSGQEAKFQNWYSNLASSRGWSSNPDDEEHQYDYRGFWQKYPQQAQLAAIDSTAHFTDEFKKPGHPTFSNESKYSRLNTRGGQWIGEKFVKGRMDKVDSAKDAVRNDSSNAKLITSLQTPSNTVFDQMMLKYRLNSKHVYNPPKFEEGGVPTRVNARRAGKASASTPNKGAIIKSQDAAVDGLVKQGVKEPSKILNYLNYTDDGKQVGDVTARDVDFFMNNDKPKVSGKFETKPPEQYSHEGVNLRDLLRFAAGKADGEEVTNEDFGNLLQTSGVKGKDAKNLTKAFQTVSKNQNLDYLLSTKGDSFNVFDKTTGEALTKSSRKTGSTKGVTFADLIGLGNNVSTLAGFASNKIGDYLKPKAEPVHQDEVKTPVINQPAQPSQPKKLPTTKVQKPIKPLPSTEKPLDNLLQQSGMRNFMLNPGGKEESQVTEDGLPQVQLPSIDKQTAAKIDEVINSTSDSVNQRQYSQYLKENHAGLFDYLVGKKTSLSNSDKLQYNADISKLKYRNPGLHQYIYKHHKSQLDKLSGNGTY